MESVQLLHRLFYHIFFFFNDTATTEIYTLSLHDALPISCPSDGPGAGPTNKAGWPAAASARSTPRSEEHTSELQSRLHLVCRLLLEKKKKRAISTIVLKLNKVHRHVSSSRHRQSID